MTQPAPRIRSATSPAGAPPKKRRGSRLVALALVACLAWSGCARLQRAITGTNGRSDAEIYRRAELERADYLAREVERLKAELRRAEKAMISSESGLRGDRSRADAVSTLAEARIAVGRASRNAPWRHAEVEEARAKLEEAERQVQADHFGSAVFFAGRAARIAETLNEEASKARRERHARAILGPRVNLRAGPSTTTPVLEVLIAATPVFPERTDGEWVLVRTPSGRIGWVHGSLLARR